MKAHRIFAIVTRHLYLYRRSLSRLMEIFYWPLLDLLLWGFITLFLDRFEADLPNFLAFFLGALILWDILYRSQQGISISFLEEIRGRFKRDLARHSRVNWPVERSPDSFLRRPSISKVRNSSSTRFWGSRIL